MSTKKNPNVMPWLAPLTFILFILIAVISFYSTRSCKAYYHRPSVADLPGIHDDNNESNSYITVTGPNGSPVRISSKLSNLVKYINISSEQAHASSTELGSADDSWKGKFQEWREKMTNTAVTPSLTNFMDIIELSKVLNEN